ncbi:hypothetical protein MF271_16420 [Deinococcus sp. KNUC1210]|uniref:hypothetical protein n=1 Tax=Deinococcus sp. KNUC1210 TaxID=2917691 RepID=UPI001EF03AFB|nr:hypothetical protein [Deinococcus sp. KNUC1210]ULH15477.1 hypothetical protein MF271_16420 [Deinococcus sp. KNUC1210]
MRPARLLLTMTALLLSAAPTLAALPATTTPAAASTLARDAALKRGRQLVTWFYAQNLTPVWAAFLPTARAGFGGDLKAFQAYRASGVVTYGKELRLISEDVRVQDGVSYYLRTATFEKGPDVQWTVVFGLDSVGRVVEFGIIGAGEALPQRVS